ncbi:hypothetical protein ANRL1_02236 [Anaerolineae bacterium]|nr:hypothetical protein ANRL1_02236 [Anaerolineae bacterium]
MIYLQCTGNVRKKLGLAQEELQAAPAPNSPLGNWTLNYIPLGGRWAFLFMSDLSLLSFPIMEGKLTLEVQDVPPFLRHGMTQLMEIVKAPRKLYASLLQDTDKVALTKATNRSLLAVQSAIAEDYFRRVEAAGGIERASLGEIIVAVNSTPRSKLKWATSFEVTLGLLRENAA